RLRGLEDADAAALFDSVVRGPTDQRVRDRIVAESRGNPLALLELPRAWTTAELVEGVGDLDGGEAVRGGGRPGGRQVERKSRRGLRAAIAIIADGHAPLARPRRRRAVG